MFNRLKRLIVLQVGELLSLLGRNDFHLKCGTFGKLRTRHELPRRKKREESCIIGYLLVILVINLRSLLYAVFGSIMYHPT